MRILGVFHFFDSVHPLWSTFQYWLDHYEVDWISLHELDNAYSIQGYDPDVIITDDFLLDVETLKEIPTIFYLLDYMYEVPREEVIMKLSLAKSVYTCSSYLSKQINQTYNMSAKVCLPYCKVEPTVPRYIIYDEGHPFIHDIHLNLPREEFRAYTSLADLDEAKIFLPYSLNDIFDNRICIAICKNIPIVTGKYEYMDEFLQSYISVNRLNKWTETVRNVLRDRKYWSDKAKTFSMRYANIENMENQVRKVVKDKLSRKDNTPPRSTYTEVQHKLAPMRTPINNRRRRAAQAQKETVNSFPVNPAIFLSGGIGDVITLESYMSDAQREALTTICYGTNKQAPIEQIFRGLPNYPNLSNHQIVWNDFSRFWCFLFKGDCNGKLAINQKTAEFNNSEDWGIMVKFPQIKSGILKYNNSSLITYKLCSIDHLPLPVNYCVICPYSSDKRIKSRDFSDDDWAAAIYHLIKRNMTAVVLNNGNEYIPDNACLINLNNKTSFIEAVEVLKKANGYIGIDSSLSVLAAKLFDYPNLMIKSQNDHCYSNKHVYYAPQSKFNFINTAIAKLIPKG